MKETYFPVPNRRNLRIHAFINIYKYKSLESSFIELNKDKIKKILKLENIGIEKPLTEEELNCLIDQTTSTFSEFVILSHEERTKFRKIELLSLELKKIFRNYDSNIFIETNKAKDDIQLLRSSVNQSIVSILQFIFFICDHVKENNISHLPIFLNPNLVNTLEKFRASENYARTILAYKSIWEDKIEMNNLFENLEIDKENKFNHLEQLPGGKIFYKIAKHIVIYESKFVEIFSKITYWETIQEMVLKCLKNISRYMSESNGENIEMDFQDFKNLCLFSCEPSIDSFYHKLIGEFLKNEKNIEKIVEEKLDKWALERLSLIDKLLIMLGFIEMKYFDEIPAQVSINEYIEIGKIYGGEKSSIFINGILDKLK